MAGMDMNVVPPHFGQVARNVYDLHEGHFISRVFTALPSS